MPSSTKMPQNMRTSLLKDMEELCHYDFNFFNIVQIQDILQKSGPVRIGYHIDAV